MTAVTADLSGEGWAFLTAVVALIVAPTWLSWWNSRKVVKTSDRIEESTNHVPAGEPNLINQVRGLTTEVKDLQLHGHWSREVLHQVAERVGVRTPTFEEWKKSLPPEEQISPQPPQFPTQRSA